MELNAAKYRRNIIIILSVVLFLGIALQTLHSNVMYQMNNQGTNHSSASGNVVNGISEAQIQQLKPEKFMIIYDSDDDDGPRLRGNFEAILDYMKKPYEAVDVKDFKGISQDYATLIIAIEDLSKIRDLDSILTYTENGGHVFFADTLVLNDTFYQIYRKLGIYSAASPVVKAGIHLVSNILIKGNNTIINNRVIANFSNVFLLDEAKCRVLAQSIDQVPLIWDIGYGRGKFLVFNGDSLRFKVNRGLIAGAISILNPDFVYPIINFRLNFIDDFPAPFPGGNINLIYTKYHRDIQTFFRDIWWPDMLKAAKLYHMKYTGVLIENYSNRVKPPFQDMQGSRIDNLITYGRELLKSGGEIGIHGYNHQSLVTDQASVDDLGYTAWSGPTNMALGLEEVERFAKSVFPNYTFRTYVPPSNILSDVGKETLLKTLPNIKILSSLYIEELDNRSYVQEFDMDSNGVFDIPRMISGYEFGDEAKWVLMNGITSIGVFSHFLHPDDLLDLKRSNGETWDRLFGEFTGMMKFEDSNFKWNTGMTASESSLALERYVKSKIWIQHTDHKILGYINGFSGEIDFVMRTDRKMTSTTNCKVERIDDGVYLIHAMSAQFDIGLD